MPITSHATPQYPPTMDDLPAPYALPTKSQPRTCDVYQRYSTNGPFKWTSHDGCSDEWLAKHPDWGLNRGVPGPGLVFARAAYDEGQEAAVRFVVREWKKGVILDRTTIVLGTGWPLDASQAAELASISPEDWKRRVERGEAPAPDYPEDAQGGLVALWRGPWWRASTVEAWARQHTAVDPSAQWRWCTSTVAA